MSVAETLKQAFRFAIQDREGLIAAWFDNDEEQVVRDAKDTIHAIKYLEAKLFKKTPQKGRSAVTVDVLRLQIQEDEEMMKKQQPAIKVPRKCLIVDDDKRCPREAKLMAVVNGMLVPICAEHFELIQNEQRKENYTKN